MKHGLTAAVIARFTSLDDRMKSMTLHALYLAFSRKVAGRSEAPIVSILYLLYMAK